jgi:hypothetical protein
MNHLRELLEALPMSVGVDDLGLSAQEVFASMEYAKRLGEQAVCFSIGDINHAVSLAVIPELCRLPYERCWFEAEFDDGDASGRKLCVAMLCTEAHGGFHAMVFLRQPGGIWSLEGGTARESLQTLSTHYKKMNWDAHADARHGVDTITYGVKAFLSALHCSNVRRQEHTPDAKLQKARAKRGKAPLFSYWTLQLNGKTERGDSQGGTHAGPRVHLRRGHPRQHAPGKWTWVQAHAVGNRAAGMVHKDYTVGPALLVPAR